MIARMRSKFSPLCVGLLLAAQATVAIADVQKEAVDAAYCVGVFGRDVVDVPALFGPSAPVHYVELLRARQAASLEEAIRQRTIDPDTAQRMAAAGEADSKSCRAISWQCVQQHQGRLARGYDVQRSLIELEDCARPAEPACQRREICGQ
jgi:hypothetical protein